MMYVFFVSVAVLICLIISVSVAASTPESTGAWATFLTIGIVGQLFVSFSVYPKRDMIIDEISSKLKTSKTA